MIKKRHMSVNENIYSLRQAMKSSNIDAFIVPSSDPHQSEYAADHWKSREWISGFTGSAGTAIVTMDHAALWTDVRYFIQADTELADSEFQLHKIIPFEETYIEWLANHLNEGATVGIDGYNFSIKQANSMRKILKNKNIQLHVSIDPISEIWKNRPSLPLDLAFIHGEDFQGEPMENRIKIIQKDLKKNQHLLVTALDDIAWLLHLRGKDVDCNPVAIAYVIVSQNEVTLYINKQKLDSKTTTTFAQNNVKIKEYNLITKDLQNFAKNETIILDDTICSVALEALINCSINVEKSLIRELKGVKNSKEIEHIREAMIKDGVALAKTFKWLEENVSKTTITEYDLLEKLIENRSKQAHYFGESFGAIVGYRGNGAIIHYAPSKTNSAQIKPSGVLLCDSGGQYFDGTTDITRTFAMGDDVPEETKLAYTLVLKGMIALDRAVFPIGTIGGQLDILARKPLWEHGLNYGHGTGHGVGYFLNVHEPPQGFAPGLSSSRSLAIMKEGMITSNEPGHYKQGEYGIRIENCVVTKKHKNPGYLCHESLTMYPIDTQLILIDKLDTSEKEWINNYHETCYQLITPRLKEEEKAWFKTKCVKI